MGISRFPIRPGVDLKNINSASPVAMEATRLAILVRMNPLARCLARLGQLNHAHRRRVATLAA